MAIIKKKDKILKEDRSKCIKDIDQFYDQIIEKIKDLKKE